MSAFDHVNWFADTDTDTEESETEEEFCDHMNTLHVSWSAPDKEEYKLPSAPLSSHVGSSSNSFPSISTNFHMRRSRTGVSTFSAETFIHDPPTYGPSMTYMSPMTNAEGSSSSNTMHKKTQKAPESVRYPNNRYQIFLSFRGPDTRCGFTNNLYQALKREEFNIFLDDQGLQRGDHISRVIMEAIENSKLLIIVFSQNFADSSWCLDEVAKISECWEKNNQLVRPIFYKVKPLDVKYQKNSYETAMAKQGRRFGKDSEKVRKWRCALSQVCALRGWHYKENSGYEHDLIQCIVEDINKNRDRL